MALQLYGFTHRLSELELMVRAHSRAQAKQIFAEYVEVINGLVFTSFGPPIHIRGATLPASGFRTTGIVNGRDIHINTALYPALILPNKISAASSADVTTQINGDTLQLIAFIQPDFLSDESDSEHIIIQKGTSSTLDFAYRLSLNYEESFELRLDLSSDGSSESSKLSVTISRPSAVTGWWVRMVWTGNQVFAFTNLEEPKETDYKDIVWQQADIAGGPALDIGGDIFESDAPVTVGDTIIALAFTGAIPRAIGLAVAEPNGIATWDMFPSRDDATLSGAWTSGGPQGETWAVEGGASIAGIV